MKISPTRVLDDAQHLLKKAVDVLEEEIAAGILAARNLENKVINVNEVPNATYGELLTRIRRDIHDSVDIMLDAFGAVVNQFGHLSSMNNKAASDPVARKNGHQIPVVTTEKSARPGEKIQLPIVLSNDDKEKEILVSLKKSDLAGPRGNKILARSIRLSPSSFSIGPLKKQEVMIKVSIPKTCRKGTYSGFVYDDNDSKHRAFLTVEVA